MRSVFKFIIDLARKIEKDEIITIANELTFKILFAFFPLVIFLTSLIGYFDIDSGSILMELEGTFPDEIYLVLKVFIHEIIDTKSFGVLITSLWLAVYTASSGFKAFIRGNNKAYNIKEKRGFLRIRITSFVLVFILVLAMVLSIAGLVFGDKIHKLIDVYFEFNEFSSYLYGFLSYLFTMILVLSTIVVIYKFSCSKYMSIYSLLPGSVTTLVIWIATSKLFNIYVNNFSKFSVTYGSIAGIIIMISWLNIVSTILLIGVEINALLEANSIMKH